MFFIFFILFTAFSAEIKFTCDTNITCKFDDITGTVTVQVTNGTTSTGKWTKMSEYYTYKDKIIKLVIGNGITSISHTLFQYSNLQSVTCTECSLTEIANNAFMGSTKITSFPSSTLKKIGNYAFNGLTNMAAFNFSSIQEIGNNAFQNTGLKNIDLPATLTSIGSNAFSGCPLESFIVNSANTNYTSDNIALYEIKNNVKSLLLYPSKNPTTTTYKILDGTTVIKSNAFNEANNLKSIDLNNVVTVEANGIFKCTSLNSINLGASTTDLKIGSFKGCSAINQFTVTNGNTFFTSEDGVLYTKETDNKALIKYPPAKQIANNGVYTIPAGIKVIYDYAFEGVTGLKELTIANDVYSIHSNAFNGCSSLTKVTITASVRSVGSSVFADLKNLKEAIIGDNVKMIGKSMFSGCGALNTFTMGKGVMTIEADSFANTKITSIEIPDSCYFIMKNAFFTCTELTTVKIGSQVKEISMNAFAYSTKLTTVDLTKATGLQRIDSNAFSGCSALKSINIPGNVKVIATGAFTGTGITTVDFKGTSQPNYCDAFSFPTTNIKVTVPQEYKNLRFCGIYIKPLNDIDDVIDDECELPDDDKKPDDKKPDDKKPDDKKPDDKKPNNGTTVISIMMIVLALFFIL